MIALIGPTRLDLTPPPDDSASLIEIALLMDDMLDAAESDEASEVITAEDDDVDSQEFSPWESEVVGNRLDELYAAGAVRRRAEGNWLIYEVTPEICHMLLLLILDRSPTPKPKAW